MNFNQIIEALGLEKLASAAGGGHDGSTGSTPRSPDSQQSPQQPGPPNPDEMSADAQAASAGPAGDGVAGGPSLDWSEEDDAGESDDESGDVAMDSGVVEEIRHELDQIAADVDGNDSQIRGIQSQYDEVLDRLDTIEEHNSQLLGVYDRLTAGINPFAESWEARYDRARENPEAAENRYNVIEPPEGAERDPVSGDAGDAVEEAPPDEVADASDASDAIGFEDLRDRQTPEPEPEPGAGSPEQPDATADGAATRGRSVADGTSDAYLTGLAAGYASEVLLMEWLTMLIDIAGPPGALKALDYYENIGWISRPVKHQVEDLLGGAHVPGDTTARTPGDLTTEEHNRSFAYIMKLAQQRQPTPGAALD